MNKTKATERAAVKNAIRKAIRDNINHHMVFIEHYPIPQQYIDTISSFLATDIIVLPQIQNLINP